MAHLPLPAAAVARTTRALAGGLLDLIYPPCCPGCAARLSYPQDPLCPRCLAGLERAEPAAVRERLDCLPAAGSFASIYALWRFDRAGVLQEVLHTLKYRNRPHHGRVLGRLLGQAYREAGHVTPDVMLPVPLHRTRRLARGYNQSELLAQGMTHVLKCPVRIHLLRRDRPTRSQTTLSRPERWTNVDGAFAVPAAAFEGRVVLLVDDVLTTGATVTAAAHALHDAGAQSVHLATLALARS